MCFLQGFIVSTDYKQIGEDRKKSQLFDLWIFWSSPERMKEYIARGALDSYRVGVKLKREQIVVA